MHKFCPIIPKVIRNLFVGSIHRKNKVQIGVLQLVKLQVTTGVPSFVIISCVLTNHILCIGYRHWQSTTTLWSHKQLCVWYPSFLRGFYQMFLTASCPTMSEKFMQQK